MWGGGDKGRDREREGLESGVCCRLWEGLQVSALEGVGAIGGGGAGGEVDEGKEGDRRVADGVRAKEGFGAFKVGAGAWDGGEEVEDGDLVGDEAGANLEAWSRVKVASKVRSMRVTKVEEAIVMRK